MPKPFIPSPELANLGKEIVKLRNDAKKMYDDLGERAPTDAEKTAIKDLNKTIEEKERAYVEREEIEAGKSANQARIDELKAPRRRAAGAFADPDDLPERGFKSIADEVFADPEFKAWIDRMKERGVPAGKGAVDSPQIPLQATKGLLTGASDTSAGAFVRPDRDTEVSLPFRILNIRDIITVGGTESDMVEFVRQVSRTNNAAEVAEATSVSGISGVKPESDLVFELVTAAVKTIATWVPSSRRALADVRQLRTIIDGELRYMVAERLEDQIVAGNGVGENLLGYINTSGLTAQAYATDLLTTTRKARTKAKIVGRAIPNAYVMNPYDWETLDLTKDAENRYYFGGPTVLGNPRLWGLPVVEHEAMPQGRATVGDHRVVTLWDREQAQIYTTDSHADFFIRNLIVVLAELRAALGVKRPAAIVDIDLTP